MEKRVMARGKRKMNSRNGSKSTIRYHIERGLDLDSSTGQIETWRLTHWDEKKKVEIYRYSYKIRKLTCSYLICTY